MAEFDEFYVPSQEVMDHDPFESELGYTAPKVATPLNKLQKEQRIKEAYKDLSKEQQAQLGPAAYEEIPTWWETLVVTNARALRTHKVTIKGGVIAVGELTAEDKELDRKLRREIVVVQLQPHESQPSENKGRTHSEFLRFWWATGEMTDAELAQAWGSDPKKLCDGLLKATKSSIRTAEALLKALGRTDALIGGEKLRTLAQVNRGDWSVLAQPGANVVRAMFRRRMREAFGNRPAREESEIIRFASIQEA